MFLWPHITFVIQRSVNICVCFPSGGQGKKNALLSSYVSPWEKAMKGDQNLIATLKTSMPGPIKPTDTPNWKTFNKYPLFWSGLYNCCVLNRCSDRPSHLPGVPCPTAASRRPNSSWNSRCQNPRCPSRSRNRPWYSSTTSAAGLPSTARQLAGWAAASPVPFTWRRRLCPLRRQTSCEDINIHSVITPAAHWLKVRRGMNACLHLSMHIHACDRWTDS